MPARTRRHSLRREIRVKKKSKSNTKTFSNKLKVFLLVLVLLIVGIIFLVTRTKYWDGQHKLSLVIAKSNGDVEVEIFDPMSDSIVSLTIPGDTEVDTARQLGKWRLKNVPKLGAKEGIGGQLLSETLTKYFKFPVYVWSEDPASGFANENLGSALRALFAPYKTNLQIGDRLRIFLYGLNVKNYKKESLDLTNSKYLKSGTLSDGDKGYILSGKIPTNILALFAQPQFSKGYGKTKIIDRGTEQFGKEVGEILEVVGLKVVSVNDETEDDSDCTVSGKNKEMVGFVSRIFNCQEETSDTEGFDVILTIGKNFDKRF